MIFLLHNRHHDSDETPKFVPSATLGTNFLFNTNEQFNKSAIAVTHTKQTTVFLFNTAERMKRLNIAVTHSKSTTAQISIQYKWTHRNTASSSKKIANSAPGIPRA